MYSRLYLQFNDRVQAEKPLARDYTNLGCLHTTG